MYEGHFQLRRRPFAATPDPICHYLSASQTPLLESVARCIDLGQGIAIATGPAGIGKTLLAQVLLAESESRFAVVYLGTGQFPTRRALLQAILYELGQSYGGMTDQELRLELNTTLRNLITQKDGLLLILDEAHLLSGRLLEEVRLVADLSQYGVPLARVVLSGNPEFEERLTSPTLAAFNQRVACHIVLEQLTRAESIEYLAYRVRWAGGDVDDIFDREALQLIADASDGIPRCLNQLADHSLMQAFLSGQTTVSADLVRQALAELQHLPLRWNASVLHNRRRESSPVTMTTPDIDQLTNVPDGSQLATSDEYDSSSCCFEFGAGDGNSEQVETESLPTVQASLIHPEETPTHVISDPEPNFQAEQQDEHPLFPWLSKTEPGTFSKEMPHDDFSTSSFTIQARRRQRSELVEHEVVSTVTLSGSDLQPKRRSEPLRPVAAGRDAGIRRDEDLPAEEVVVDQYAALDARMAPLFPRSPVAFPQAALSTDTLADHAPLRTESELEPSLESIDEELLVAKSAHRTRTEIAGNPVDRIDALCELLEQVDSAAPVRGGVELITEYGVERVDVDLKSDMPVPVETSASPVGPVDLEDWIGSTVVEIGRDLQHAIAETSPRMVDRARAEKIDQLLNRIEQETGFDIVEPDPVETIDREYGESNLSLADHHPEHARVVPPPNHSYKNFFSVLRRRQTR